MKGAYYNEIDPHAAKWLRELIAAGHIAPGDVDERSIVDVQPDDLRGYVQCHFFAGIGGWNYALRLAGIPDSRPVWSGSAPCQPFSAAGKQRGSEDERHLWPAFFRLIRECRPRTVIGEQVAGASGYAWWDHVAADLEGAGYAAAAADIGAHSVGAPHIRQRLYWVAHRTGERSLPRSLAGVHSGEEGAGARYGEPERHSSDGGMAHADSEQRGATCGQSDSGSNRRDDTRGRGEDGMAHAEHSERWAECETHGQAHWWDGSGGRGDPDGRGEVCGVGDTNGRRRGQDDGARTECVASDRQRKADWGGGSSDASPWSDLIWLPCSDGKSRPAKPGVCPLVAGLPRGVVRSGDPGAPIDANDTPEARVMRLRGYGNAIVPQVAAAFIKATMT